MSQAPLHRSVAWCVAFALGACQAEPEALTSSPTAAAPRPLGSTGDTAAPTDPFDLSCDVEAHALRVPCAWSGLDEPGELRLGDGSSVWAVGELVDPQGEVLIEGLRPDTTYTWRLPHDGAERTGSFTTRELPPGAGIRVDIRGTPSMPLVGLQTPCSYDNAYLVLDVDPDLPAPKSSGLRPGPDSHRVVGYEYVTDHQSGVLKAVSFTEDDTTLGLSSFPGGVVELDRSGRSVWQVDEDQLYDTPHHDVFRRDGLTFVLVQDFVDGVYMDAVQVFDAAGNEVALWRLWDHLGAPKVDGRGYMQGDYSHANSIWVDEVGDWYLSSRHLSAVFKIAGLNAPDAGAVRWVLAGDPDEVRIEGTLQLPEGVSFVRQHNVHLTDDGKLALFDNRFAYPELSRVLWLNIDEEAGQATVDQLWTLPVHCPFQGGAWTTEAGTVVATCSPRRLAFELVPDVPEPVAEIEVSCTSSVQEAYIPRMVPLTSW